MLVAANKQLYVTLPKRQKMLLSRSIVHAVRSQTPPGRFLQKDSKSDRWCDIGDQRAQEKTSQALREGAPELKTKLKPSRPGSSSKSGGSAADAVDSLSDEGGARSSTPSVGGDSGSEGPSNPPSVATTIITAPRLHAQTSNNSVPNSVGQVLPPPSETAVATDTKASEFRQPQLTSSMPPPALRPPGIAESGPSQEEQQLQQKHQQHHQQQHFQQPFHLHQQQQYQQPMPVHPAFLQQNGMPQMMHAQHPQQMMNGTPVYFAAGPNMNPMPMYPTMMMNQQGIMVPVMSMIPPNMLAQGQGQGYNPANINNTNNNNNNNNSSNNDHHQKNQLGGKVNGSVVNDSNDKRPLQQSNEDQYQHQQQQQQQQQPTHFEQRLEGLVLPPDGLEAGGFSFGSIMMTEHEMKRLEQAGASFGQNQSMGFDNNGSGHGNNHTNNNNINNNMNAQRLQHQFLQQQYLQQQIQFMEQYNLQQQQLAQHQQQMGFHKSEDDVAKMAPPPDGGLEPQGLSFGSVSLMSFGDARLETTGISFGSAMSFKMAPDMVDGGLDGIGMSFGSMTLGTTNEEPFDMLQSQHNIMPPPPQSGPNATKSPDAFPTLFQQNRSNVNLLECSDTESDDDEPSTQRSQQKNLEWERMQALVQAGHGNTNSVPEPVQMPMQNFPTSFAIPNTRFERDFSQMSQLSVGEPGDQYDQHLYSITSSPGMPMPPPPPKKQGDDGEWQNAELVMLKTQQSGASNYGGQR
jgi:hypothetical protein